LIAVSFPQLLLFVNFTVIFFLTDFGTNLKGGYFFPGNRTESFSIQGEWCFALA